MLLSPLGTDSKHQTCFFPSFSFKKGLGIMLNSQLEPRLLRRPNCSVLMYAQVDTKEKGGRGGGLDLKRRGK